jgi:hypothetical protein
MLNLPEKILFKTFTIGNPRFPIRAHHLNPLLPKVSSGYATALCREEVMAYAALPGKRKDTDLRSKCI